VDSLLRERRASKRSPTHAIPRRNEKGPIALSFAQQRLWFLHRMEPESPLYNIPSAFRIHGGLDVESLRKAIAAVGSRHETLRTVFPETDGEPSQVITDTGSTELVELDLSNRLETEKLLEAHRFLSKEAERPFDLSKDLPCRFTLLKIEPKDHILLIIEHHIASDGWSRGILWGEISKLYKSFCTGETAALPDLPIQYADFAVWQRQWLQGPTLEKQLNYWKQQLSGSSPFLQLPADRPRPPVQSYRGSTESFLLPLGLLHSLQTLSRQENSTLFMTLLAAFNILLYRYTGQQDIVVGSPIAGRNRLEIENLIGFFVNTLALRSDLSANPSFRHLLTRVRETCLQAYAHQDLPFEKLVEELQPERNLSYSPFFQVMFVLQNAPMQPLELSGLQITPIEIHTGTSKFDLTFSLTTTVDGLHGTIEYSTDLFDASTIQRLAGHFQTLLQGIVDDPDQPIARLPLLTDSERHRILVEWNNTKTDYPGDQCVHQLFEAQVEKTPNANAVVF
jgi:hypothetical protein